MIPPTGNRIALTARCVLRAILAVSALLFLFAGRAAAQEPPYFVTYSSAIEEPGDLEISLKSTQASPANGNAFLGSALEFEYGVKGWWTTEFYLDGQTTRNDSTLFTGFRWENRFRPLLHEHFINPVLYVEYENTNRADRSLLEVVGHDSVSDLAIPNAAARREIEREMELKLILGSDVRGWNFSENFIAEKALNEKRAVGIRIRARERAVRAAWTRAARPAFYAARISRRARNFMVDWAPLRALDGKPPRNISGRR